jgi:hypothetical protein
MAILAMHKSACMGWKPMPRIIHGLEARGTYGGLQPDADNANYQ